MGSITWGEDLAEVYDATYSAMFEPPVLNPTVDRLAELAQGGPALEFAVGTGRVALPLSGRGISVYGFELSPHMAEKLLAKPGADAVPVTIGDMTTTRVPGAFKLVYLVANTIMNVTTQEDQIAVFANAAAHLESGGCFVVEVIVPQLRLASPQGIWVGSSPSIPTTSGSRPSTTWSDRSHGPTTGWRSAGASFVTPRPTATSGRRSYELMARMSQASAYCTAGRAGTRRRSRLTARVRFAVFEHGS